MKPPRRRRESATTPPSDLRAAKIARAILAIAILVVPILVMPAAANAFRLPKVVVLRAAGFLLMIVGAVWALRRPHERSQFDAFRLPLGIVAAVIGWTAITAATAMHHWAAFDALVTVVTAAAFFSAVVLVSRNLTLHAVSWLLIPAIVNVAVVIGQIFGHSPVGYDRTIAGRPGLIGNQNDLGAFFVAPALAAAAAAAATRGKLRVAYAVAAAALTAGAVLSNTSTAVVTLVMAFPLIGIRLSPRKSAIAAIAVLAMAVAFVAGGYAIRRAHMRSPWLEPAGRLSDKINAIAQHRYDSALSSRTTAFLAAWRMGTRHPLFGVGPGGYGPEYFNYKLEIDARYPEWQSLSAARGQNFGEAHNDHLQVFAETGIPGYLLLAASLIVLAANSFQTGTDSVRSRFARIASLPLATGFAVLALAQFPLRLAAPLTSFLFIAGLCVGWTRIAE